MLSMYLQRQDHQKDYNEQSAYTDVKFCVRTLSSRYRAKIDEELQYMILCLIEFFINGLSDMGRL